MMQAKYFPLPIVTRGLVACRISGTSDHLVGTRDQGSSDATIGPGANQVGQSDLGLMGETMEPWNIRWDLETWDHQVGSWDQTRVCCAMKP